VTVHSKFGMLLVDAHCFAAGSAEARFLHDHMGECAACHEQYWEHWETRNMLQMIRVTAPKQVTTHVEACGSDPMGRRRTVPRVGWAAAAVLVALVSAVSVPAIASHVVGANRVNGSGYVPNSSAPYNFTPSTVPPDAISLSSALQLAEQAFGFSSGLPTGINASVQFGEFSSTLYMPQQAWVVNFTGMGLPPAPVLGVGGNGSVTGPAPAPLQNMTVALDGQSGQVLEKMEWSVAPTAAANSRTTGTKSTGRKR
jgi:hypothetical protein